METTELFGPQADNARFQEHLVILERFAIDRGMDLIAHLLGCARVALEEDLSVAPVIGHIN